MRMGGWEEHQPLCDTLVTVYESLTCYSETTVGSPDAGGDFLRAVVYNVKMGASSQVEIKSSEDLRQVIFSSNSVLSSVLRHPE